MTQHTPTPWAIESGDEIYAKDGLVAFAATTRRTREQDETNAAFIVRACNAHDALVEALEFYDEAVSTAHSANDLQSMMLTFKQMKDAAIKLARVEA